MPWINNANQITEPLNWQQLIFLQIRDIERLRYTDKAACTEAIKGLESLMNDKIIENNGNVDEIKKVKDELRAGIKELPEKNRKDEKWMIVFRANYWDRIYLEILKVVSRHYSPLSRVQHIIDD